MVREPGAAGAEPAFDKLDVDLGGRDDLAVRGAQVGERDALDFGRLVGDGDYGPVLVFAGRGGDAHLGDDGAVARQCIGEVDLLRKGLYSVEGDLAAGGLDDGVVRRGLGEGEGIAGIAEEVGQLAARDAFRRGGAGVGRLPQVAGPGLEVGRAAKGARLVRDGGDFPAGPGHVVGDCKVFVGNGIVVDEEVADGAPERRINDGGAELRLRQEENVVLPLETPVEVEGGAGTDARVGELDMVPFAALDGILRPHLEVADEFRRPCEETNGDAPLLVRRAAEEAQGGAGGGQLIELHPEGGGHLVGRHAREDRSLRGGRRLRLPVKRFWPPRDGHGCRKCGNGQRRPHARCSKHGFLSLAGPLNPANIG